MGRVEGVGVVVEANQNIWKNIPANQPDSRYHTDRQVAGELKNVIYAVHLSRNECATSMKRGTQTKKTGLLEVETDHVGNYN